MFSIDPKERLSVSDVLHDKWLTDKIEIQNDKASFESVCAHYEPKGFQVMEKWMCGPSSRTYFMVQTKSRKRFCAKVLYKCEDSMTDSNCNAFLSSLKSLTSNSSLNGRIPKVLDIHQNESSVCLVTD